MGITITASGKRSHTVTIAIYVDSCDLVEALAKCAFVEALEFSKKRSTFGKALVEHQVIRHKLAEMYVLYFRLAHFVVCKNHDYVYRARHLLATHYYIEKLAYQMTSDKVQYAVFEQLSTD